LLDEFPAVVSADLRGLRPVGCKDAARAVFQGRSRYVDPGQAAHVREALPQGKCAIRGRPQERAALTRRLETNVCLPAAIAALGRR
jgi:hypothetical protein